MSYPPIPNPTRTASLSSWARQHGTRHTLRFRCNAYSETDPRAEWRFVEAYTYTTDNGGRGCVIFPGALDAWKNATESLYIIDNGTTVVPMYVAGFRAPVVMHDGPHGCHIILHEFPTNYDNDGNRRMRADRPTEPVDYSSWSLPPRTAYHCKATRPTVRETLQAWSTDNNDNDNNRKDA